MTVSEISAVIHSYCSSRPDVMEAWFYGSRAEGRNRAESDIDVFFELDPAYQKSDWDVMTDWDDDKQRVLADLAGRFPFEFHPVTAYPTLETWGVREKAHTGILVFRRAA